MEETGAGDEIVWRGGGLTGDLFRPRFFDACLPSRPANVFQKLLALWRIGTVFYFTLLDTQFAFDGPELVLLDYRHVVSSGGSRGD
jgi:hypothetical protein